MRKEEYSLRYATLLKQDIFDRISWFDGKDLSSPEIQEHLMYFKELLSEYTEIQSSARKRLRHLRNLTSTAHLVLQNE